MNIYEVTKETGEMARSAMTESEKRLDKYDWNLQSYLKAEEYIGKVRRAMKRAPGKPGARTTIVCWCAGFNHPHTRNVSTKCKLHRPHSALVDDNIKPVSDEK